MFVIGIDGGGTKTRVEIRNDKNQLLQRKIYGAFNINSIGRDAFRKRLNEIFSENMADCLSICIGAAGISNPDAGHILQEVLEQSDFRGTVKLCGDHEIALRGAMDTPGIGVIAGTGSICFGKNADGVTARSGGYGHLIDDCGSGYALGRDGLSACVRMFDGRAERSILQDRILDALGIAAPEELISFVYSADTKKSHIAVLAESVLQAAEDGDPMAMHILHQEADEIVQMVSAVQRKLSLAGCPIALLGGLFASCNPYYAIVQEKLSRMGEVKAPAHDALWGAAQMAWEMQK